MSQVCPQQDGSPATRGPLRMWCALAGVVERGKDNAVG